MQGTGGKKLQRIKSSKVWNNGEKGDENKHKLERNKTASKGEKEW